MTKNVDTKKTLIEKLRSIFDDKDFVVGVISNASHEDDRKSIIEYIENGEDVTVENIILLSVYLDEKRS